MTAPIFIAIDLGTTGNRAIAFNTQGQSLASSYTEFTQTFPSPGWVEHDPMEIFQSTLTVLLKVLSKVPPSSVKGLCITNQRETTIIWDKKTGIPIHPAIVWQCKRTTQRCMELNPKEDFFQKKTGLRIDPYFSATKIEWILRTVPGAQKRAENGELLFGTVDTWIIWNLTQGKHHITDASNASRTLLYDINTGTFDPDLCRVFNIPASLLPTVTNSAGNLGLTDAAIVGHQIPIVSVIGDQQASLFAQCGDDTKSIKNTYGTGLFICSSTGHSRSEHTSLLSTVAWQRDNTLSYAVEGSVFVGGSALQWLRDGLQLFDDVSVTSDMASSVDDNGGVYFVPALVGLGAPHWNPNARGTFSGITRGTSRAHIVRATLESLAFQTYDVIRCLSSDVQLLKVDGGASNNDFLMQFQSDILGIPVAKTSITETTAFGAFGIAATSQHLLDDDAFRSLNPVIKLFEPKISEDQRTSLLSGWMSCLQKAQL